MIRAKARAAVGTAFDSQLAGRWATKILAQPATHLLYLHDGPDEAWFRSLVDDLSDLFDLVSFEDAVRRISGGNHPRPSIAFSFDDGFESNAMHARVLAERGLSAAFFVCTGLVGRDRAGVDEFFGAPQPEGVLGWDELSEMVAAGHVIGSHTVSHPDLSALDLPSILSEVETSREKIRSEFGSCEHFAWPYGRAHHISPDALEWLRDSDFRSVASAVRGSHDGEQASRVLLRHVIQPGQSTESVLAFLALALKGADNHRKERSVLS